jgi:hypothetical protein
MYKRCVSTPLPKVSLLIIRRGYPKMTSSTSNLSLIYDGMETYRDTHTSHTRLRYTRKDEANRKFEKKIIFLLMSGTFSNDVRNEWDVLQWRHTCIQNLWCPHLPFLMLCWTKPNRKLFYEFLVQWFPKSAQRTTGGPQDELKWSANP